MKVNHINQEVTKKAFAAALSGDLEGVKQFVEHSRFNLEDRDGENSTILHYAARSGNLE